MPITSELLRNIMAEARPIIERQMNDAKLIAGFRDLVSSNGGDWSSLKALIKAHVEDEADDDGEGKRVRKILDKADSSTAYADMLGLAKMNEGNFSASQSYSEAKGRGVDAASTPPHVSETGDLGIAPKASVSHASSAEMVDLGTASFDPETGDLTDNQEHEVEVTTSRPEAVANSAVDIDTPATENGFADDVGATASSTNPPSARTSSPVSGTAGGVVPPAPPVTHSDMPDIPASLDRRQPKAREWGEA